MHRQAPDLKRVLHLLARAPNLRLLPPQACAPMADTRDAHQGSSRPGPMEANTPGLDMKKYHGMKFDPKPMETTMLPSCNSAAASTSHAAGSLSLSPGSHHVPLNSSPTGDASTRKKYVTCSCQDDSSFFCNCTRGGFGCTETWASAAMAGMSTLTLTLSLSDFPNLATSPKKYFCTLSDYSTVGGQAKPYEGCPSCSYELSPPPRLPMRTRTPSTTPLTSSRR